MRSSRISTLDVSTEKKGNAPRKTKHSSPSRSTAAKHRPKIEYEVPLRSGSLSMALKLVLEGGRGVVGAASIESGSAGATFPKFAAWTATIPGVVAALLSAAWAPCTAMRACKAETEFSSRTRLSSVIRCHIRQAIIQSQLACAGTHAHVQQNMHMNKCTLGYGALVGC